jgi:hypothetical protein
VVIDVVVVLGVGAVVVAVVARPHATPASVREIARREN